MCINIFAKLRVQFSRLLQHKQMLRLLKHTGLFAELSRANLKALAKTARKKEYHAGEIILKMSDTADNFYIVMQGTVKIFLLNEKGEEIILAKLEKEAYFGEQALLDEQPGKRNANAIAETAVTLLAVSQQNFFGVLKKTKKLKPLLQRVGNEEFIARLAKKMDIFHEVGRAEIESLAGNIIDFPSQHIIFHKGDAPDFTYYLIAGKIKIILDETKSQDYIILQPGQLFGELGVIARQPRSGAAIALEDVKVLRIRADIFQRLYAATPQLRELIGTLNETYANPFGGIISQYTGTFLGEKTVNTAFNLVDNRTVLVSRVIAKEIFNIALLNIPDQKKIRYQQGNIIREISLVNHVLVGVMSIGHWDEIRYICSAILDGLVLAPENISVFKRTGNLSLQQVQYPNIVCNCMHISRQQLIQSIQAGNTTLEAISCATGAGTVCGSCRPDIYDLLGKQAWSLAYFDKILVLNPQIKLYQIKLYDNKYLPYLPGQHLVLEFLIDRHWIQRSYSLTSLAVQDNYYEIIVKQEREGALTPWLFANDNQPLLMRVSAPQGEFIFNRRKKKSAVFFAGGIGVTPALAFARNLATNKVKRRLHLYYVARTAADFILLNELTALTQKIPLFTFETHEKQKVGLVAQEKIQELINEFPNADFYICGSLRFNTAVKEQLLLEGVAAAKIYLEIFVEDGNKTESAV